MVRLPEITTILWLAFTALAAGAWFVTGSRLAGRAGLDVAAPAVGVTVAVAVGITLWRWAGDDRRSAALSAGRCPRCTAALETEHRHARPGALDGGLTTWRCPSCAFEHAEALTCEWCRP